MGSLYCFADSATAGYIVLLCVAKLKQSINILRSILIVAGSVGSEELMKAMLKPPNRNKLIRAPSTRKDKEVLHVAGEEGHLQIIDLVFEFGAVLELRDCDHNEVLLSAINHVRIDICRLIRIGSKTGSPVRAASDSSIRTCQGLKLLRYKESQETHIKAYTTDYCTRRATRREEKRIRVARSAKQKYPLLAKHTSNHLTPRRMLVAVA